MSRFPWAGQGPAAGPPRRCRSAPQARDCQAEARAGLPCRLAGGSGTQGCPVSTAPRSASPSRGTKRPVRRQGRGRSL